MESSTLHDLRITRVALENIRCFENIELDLTDQSEPVNLSVILGDNGVGKSTLRGASATIDQ